MILQVLTITRKEYNPIVYTLEVQVDYFLNGFSLKTIALVRVYYQKILGNVIFMVFDFQGIHQFLSHSLVAKLATT